MVEVGAAQAERKRSNRMANCPQDAEVLGFIKFNDCRIPLPEPFSWDAIQAAMPREDCSITDLYAFNLTGPFEAVNELLDFSLSKVPA